MVAVFATGYQLAEAWKIKIIKSFARCNKPFCSMNREIMAQIFTFHDYSPYVEFVDLFKCKVIMLNSC